jgi:hypothetical protein
MNNRKLFESALTREKHKKMEPAMEINLIERDN